MYWRVTRPSVCHCARGTRTCSQVHLWGTWGDDYVFVHRGTGLLVGTYMCQGPTSLSQFPQQGSWPQKVVPVGGSLGGQAGVTRDGSTPKHLWPVI